MITNTFKQTFKALGIALILFSDAHAYDGGRSVFVNGRQLSQLEITQLEQQHGDYIPDGNYWLDYNSGYWGYVGGPAQGVLGSPEIEFTTGVSEGRADKRWFEDEVADFCARNGGC